MKTFLGFSAKTWIDIAKAAAIIGLTMYIFNLLGMDFSDKYHRN